MKIKPPVVNSHVVITIGYATQTHWLVVVREDVHFGEGGLEIDYAEHLFSFWEHPFYRAGGVGDIPANWHWFWGLRK